MTTFFSEVQLKKKKKMTMMKIPHRQ